MNRRVLLLVLIIVVVLGAAAVFLLPQLLGQQTPTPVGGNQGGPTVDANQPTATPIQLKQVIVAIQEIPRGARIPKAALGTRLWPVASVPERAVTSIDQIADRLARTNILIEQPIVDTLIVDDLASLTKGGSDAAAVIPKGRVAISVPVDRLTDVGYSVADGDYVDVIVSFLFVDVDPNFQSIKPNKLILTSIKSDGTIELLAPIQGEFQPSNFSQFPVVSSPTEVQRPRLVTQRTIQSAWVIHVGTFPLNGSFLRPVATPVPTPTPEPGEPTKAAPPPTPTPPFPDIVTLAVEPQDAVTLTWIIEAKIPITLVLRSAQGDAGVASAQTAPVSLQYMVDTFQIPEPQHLPFALEPALRSIRSLQVGNEIALSDAAK